MQPVLSSKDWLLVTFSVMSHKTGAKYAKDIEALISKLPNVIRVQLLASGMSKLKPHEKKLRLDKIKSLFAMSESPPVTPPKPGLVRVTSNTGGKVVSLTVNYSDPRAKSLIDQEPLEKFSALMPPVNNITLPKLVFIIIVVLLTQTICQTVQLYVENRFFMKV